MKRILDMTASTVGLIFLSPVLIAIACILKLTSPGPAIFSQTRVGKNEEPFTCYKFRTMKVNTAQRATHEIGSDAIIPFGRVLRRYKLDELPQLWNVLRGEMSLVGPRPCLPNQTELVEARRSLGVYDIRPGITGLAQVDGIDMSQPLRLAETDAEYVAKRTFALDLGLILRTIFRS